MCNRKLVYILHGVEVGGVEVALISAIPLLCVKFDLKVIVLGKINSQLIQHLTSKEQSVFVSFDYSLITYPSKLNIIVNYILALKPEIVISSLWRASWIGRIVKKKYSDIIYISFIHSVKFFHFLDAFFSRNAINSADAIFVDSQSTQEFVEKIINNKKCINKISFLTVETPRENKVLKTNYNIDGAIKIMFLGRINKVKNLPFTIKFIKSLIDAKQNIYLDIYGRDDNDGDYQVVEKMILDYNLKDRISFKGEINPNARFDLFKDYNFFIQLSLIEGMAMSVVEAMQNGLIPIVTPVGEIPNYSTDMISAIYLNDRSALSIEEAKQKVIKTINNSILYNKISNNSFLQFKDQEIFRESIVRNINAIISGIKPINSE